MSVTPNEMPTTTASPLARLEITTPLGPFWITAADDAVVRVRRVRESDRSPTDADQSPAALHHCVHAAEELAAYFDGTLRDFTVPIRLAGRPFQAQVWRRLQAIPYGATQTYGDLALLLGDGGASRAVGVACGANPIPLIVPCHRVVAADGALGGFGLGLEAKVWLLEREGARARQLSLF